MRGIIVIPTQGFANRLRMIASAYIYANYLNLPLFICWNPAEECNAKYSDIFGDNHLLFNTMQFSELSIAKYIFFGIVHTNSLFEKIALLLTNPIQEYEYIVLQGGHEFMNLNMTMNQFLLEKHIFYKSLTFSNKVLTKYDMFINKLLQVNDEYITNQNNTNNKKTKTLGIHIRTENMKYDGADLNNESQSQNSSSSITSVINFSVNSPITEFVSIIQKINPESYDNIIIVSNSYNSAVFLKDALTLICSQILKQQNKPSKQILITSLEDNNISNRKTFDARNLLDGVIDGVVDFLLISKCEMIIGTYYSSFSDEASFFNFIPKITPVCSKIQRTDNYHCYNYSRLQLKNKSYLYGLNLNPSVISRFFS
jgi:hypothetical protein